MVHLDGRDDHHGLQLLLAVVSSTSTEKRRPEFLNAILGRGIINYCMLIVRSEGKPCSGSRRSLLGSALAC
jgi:hypothetical protein